MRARYWNPPTGIELKAGEAVSYSLVMGLTASGPRSRDAKLLQRGAAVVRGIPGYVIPTDSTSSFLYVTPPRGTTLTTLTMTPPGTLVAGTPVVVGDGRMRVPISGLSRSRVRVSIAFSDGSQVGKRLRQQFV